MLFCKKKSKKIRGERSLKIRLMLWHLLSKLAGPRSCTSCVTDNWNSPQNKTKIATNICLSMANVPRKINKCASGGLAILLSIVFFLLAINSSTNAHEKGPPQGDESERSFFTDERRTIYVN